jgi:hypothetical protein
VGSENGNGALTEAPAYVQQQLVSIDYKALYHWRLSILDDTKIGHIAWSIAQALAVKFQWDGARWEVECSREVLAGWCRMSTSTVKLGLDELVRREIVFRVTRGAGSGRGNANRYRPIFGADVYERVARVLYGNGQEPTVSFGKPPTDEKKPPAADPPKEEGFQVIKPGENGRPATNSKATPIEALEAWLALCGWYALLGESSAQRNGATSTSDAPPAGKLPRGECSSCRKLVPVRVNGTAREHRSKYGGDHVCRGSGELVKRAS